MSSPLQPWQKPPQAPPAPSQYLGTDHEGRPVYGTPATPPAPGAVAPLQPLVARPWGAYITLAVVGGFALMFLMIGLAIVAAVLGIATVSLTICVLVLRSMWRDYQRDKEW